MSVAAVLAILITACGVIVAVLVAYGVGYDHGRNAEREMPTVPGWDLRHPVVRRNERGASLVTHALGVAVVIGLVLWCSSTFGGVS